MMRVPILLIALSLLAMLLAGASVQGEEVAGPDAPTGSTFATEGDEDLEMAAELEVSDDAGKQEEDAIEDMVKPAWEEAVEREVEGKIDLKNLWRDPPEGASLLWRLSVAVLRSRAVPSGKGKTGTLWQKCGKELPQEDVVRASGEWAFTFLASLDRVEEKTGVRLPIWGVFASHANEGGFDPCALDFATRKWAAEHEAPRLTCEIWRGKESCKKVSRKLVKRFALSLDSDTVWTILHDSYYATAKVQVKNKAGEMVWKSLKGKSDMGPWQIRTSVKKLTMERFGRQMSMVPGVYMGALEMARRAISYSYRYHVKEPHPRPWMLWQGWNPYTPTALLYDSKVTSVARWLGARRDEIERGFLVLDTKGKKNKYRLERIR